MHRSTPTNELITSPEAITPLIGADIDPHRLDLAEEFMDSVLDDGQLSAIGRRRFAVGAGILSGEEAEFARFAFSSEYGRVFEVVHNSIIATFNETDVESGAHFPLSKLIEGDHSTMHSFAWSSDYHYDESLSLAEELQGLGLAAFETGNQTTPGAAMSPTQAMQLLVYRTVREFIATERAASDDRHLWDVEKLKTLQDAALNCRVALRDSGIDVGSDDVVDSLGLNHPAMQRFDPETPDPIQSN